MKQKFSKKQKSRSFASLITFTFSLLLLSPIARAGDPPLSQDDERVKVLLSFEVRDVMGRYVTYWIEQGLNAYSLDAAEKEREKNERGAPSWFFGTSTPDERLLKLKKKKKSWEDFLSQLKSIGVDSDRWIIELNSAPNFTRSNLENLRDCTGCVRFNIYHNPNPQPLDRARDLQLSFSIGFEPDIGWVVKRVERFTERILSWENILNEKAFIKHYGYEYWGVHFLEIPPGTFQMGSPEDEVGRRANETQHQVTLTHGFLILDREVTNELWAKIWGMELKDVPSTKRSRFFTYHPVESITFWSALAFANEVSEIFGLPPCYAIDFTKCSGSGKDGTLSCPEEAALKINANTIYECKGFRLPTEAEWEYVARGGAKVPTAYAFGNNEDELSKYAWYGESLSDGSSHFVATKNPTITFNNQELFDIYGNVGEWVQDAFSDDYPTFPVSDPFVEAAGFYRVIRGGDWHDGYDYDDAPRYLRSAARGINSPSYRHDCVGLRLVRTIQK